MSANTQNNAPVSAESVVTLNGAQLLQALDFIAPDRDTDPHQLECELTISFADGPAGGGYYCYCTDYPDEGAIMLDAETADDLISSDSDTELTQQTLDDVNAGIPARDAEIDALRKEIETLQAAQAQPTGLVKQLCDALELAKTCHGAMLMSDPPQEMWKARGVDRVISEALNAAQAQLPVSGAVQFRDAAQMIEPSGNSGQLAREFAHQLNQALKSLSPKYFNSFNVRTAIQDTVHSFTRIGHDELAKLTESSSQQDADKVDTERYRAWRDALITGKTAEDDFIRLVADNLPTSVGVSRRPTAAEWDAAIDAARKEPGQ